MAGPKKKKVGVILAGCGFQDGSEIHESVLTLLYLDLAGAETVCYSLDKAQTDVIDHKTGALVKESRNALTEAARIARGAVTDIKKAKAADFDALILPGGYGAAKILCNFAAKGAECSVDPEVERLLLETQKAGKPIGAICIAPAVVARAFKGKKDGVILTIGRDEGTAEALERMGAEHEMRRVDEIAVDEDNKVVSTPAYMMAKSIKEAAAGIEKLVKKVVELA